ncbi:MAG: hypothetical protein AAF701_10320 [Pseudomonadota bacterium]
MDTLFFIVSKLGGALLQPESWIIIWLIWLVLRPTRAKAMGLLVVLALVAIFPVADFVLGPLERLYAQPSNLTQIDGIIVLGGGENGILSNHWQQPILREGGERLTTAIALDGWILPCQRNRSCQPFAPFA